MPGLTTIFKAFNTRIAVSTCVEIKFLPLVRPVKSCVIRGAPVHFFGQDVGLGCSILAREFNHCFGGEIITDASVTGTSSASSGSSATYD